MDGYNQPKMFVQGGHPPYHGSYMMPVSYIRGPLDTFPPLAQSRTQNDYQRQSHVSHYQQYDSPRDLHYPARNMSYPSHSQYEQLSPVSSATPNTSWASVPHRQPHAYGTPSTSRSSSIHFDYASPPSRNSYKSPPSSRPPSSHMNATAPAFTPFGNSREPLTGHQQNGASFSPTDRNTPLPRLHRTAPSISLRTFPEQQQRFCPPPHSPLASRGVSPSGSNFTSSSDAPLLNAYGLPITKIRNYKVKLPLEANTSLSEERRSRSIWSRQPSSIDCTGYDDHEDICIAAETRSRSPHPEEAIAPAGLPDTLDIYLPDDWQALRKALFEESMKKLGIDQNYLTSMNSLPLNARDADRTVHSNPSHHHARTGSLFTSFPHPPFAHSRETRFPSKPAPSLPFVRGHQGAMSMAAFSSTGPGKFLRQTPPFGPRGGMQNFGTAEASTSATVSQLSATLEELEHDEDEIEAKRATENLAQPEPEPSEIKDENAHDANQVSGEAALPSAKSMTWKELSAGFGFECDSEDDENPLAVKDQSPLLQINSAAMPAGFASERIAIEGAVGYLSMPSSATSNVSIEDSGIHLGIDHVARKSASAPDLHGLEAEQAQAHLKAEESHGEESDVESDAGTEYSNPSDEERALIRRNKLVAPASLPVNSSHFHAPHRTQLSTDGQTVGESPNGSMLGHIAPPVWSKHEAWHSNTLGFGTQTPQLHNASGSGSSAAIQHRSTSLNAFAVPFVTGSRPLSTFAAKGSHSHSRDQLSGVSAGSAQSHPKTSLNVAAPAFVPSFMSHQPAIVPAKAEPAGQGPCQLDAPSDTAIEDKVLHDLQLAQAKKIVDDWLSDVSSPAADHDAEEFASRDLHMHTEPENTDRSIATNMRGFKFPHLTPMYASEPHLQYLTSAPPQIAPFNTIGHSTFRAGLQDLAFDMHDSDNDEELTLPTKKTLRGPRLPIPDFGAMEAKDQASLAGYSSPRKQPLSPGVPLNAAVAKGGPLSEFGAQVATAATHSSYDTSLSAPDSQRAESSAHEGAKTDQSDNESIPSDVVRAYQLSRGGSDPLRQSWRVFEAILDRKLEHLRIDAPTTVSASHTPLPLSAEARGALASTVATTDMKDVPSKHKQEDRTEEGVSQSLLQAIHETRSMVQSLAGRSHDSIKDIADLLSNRTSDTGQASHFEQEGLISCIVQELKTVLKEQEHTQQTVLHAVVTKLGDQLRSQAYDSEHIRAESRGIATAVEGLHTLLERHKMDQNSTENSAHMESNLRESVEQSITDAFSMMLPKLLESVMPVVTPLPGGSIGESHHDEDLLNDLLCQGRETRSLLQEVAEQMTVSDASKEMVPAVIENLQAECQYLRSELQDSRQRFDTEVRKHETEIEYLRGTVNSKDSQLDLLRRELLDRATLMDKESKAKDQEHNRAMQEAMVCGNDLEIELALMKAQLKESAERSDKLSVQLEEARSQIIDLERLRHIDVALAEERGSHAQMEKEASRRREEHGAQQITKLQEILASNSAIHSNLKAQADATAARFDVLRSELESKNAALAAAQSQEDILKAELRTVHAMQRKGREAFDTLSQHAAMSSQNMQEMMHAFFNGFEMLAAQSRDAMLALMLSYDAEISLNIPYHQIRFDTFTSKALDLEKDKNIEIVDDQKMRCSSAPPQITTLTEMPTNQS